MTANVALTDTFDQWRVKTNEVVVMTQTDGMSNFIKILDTTNSTSNTTGSIITAGGIGIAKSAVIGEHLRVHGNVITDGDTTISGNLVFGDAATDQVTFTADINSSVIPNANVTFNLGNTTMLWANTFTGHVGITQKSDAGKPALSITSGDVDQIAVDVTASQTTADVINMAADSVTTAKVIDITADALTTGSALYIDSDSAATDTRSIASIIQNHASATGSTALTLQADAGRGLFIDTNLAAGGFALEIDSEHTTTNAISINVDPTTTGTAFDLTADGLTTGGIMALTSDSSDTGTRSLVKITNDHASATGVTPLHVKQDSTQIVAKFEGTTTIVVPVGTSSNRGTAVQGGMRYNTTTSSFEGYSGSTWAGLGGLIDVDQDTKIIAETSAGADNDDLDFYTAGTQRMKIDETGIITVGVDDTGYDVKFFGATAGKYLLWDESADKLIIAGDLGITGGFTHTGAFTVGVDDTGHDVKFFGASAAAFMEWDESADELEIRGPVATPGKLLLSTAEPSTVDGNKLGQIDFQAPVDGSGTDAILVGASIWAEADGTFSASVNETELVFATASSETAAEKMRLDKAGNLGIGTATPSTKLEVSGVITETSMREAKTNIENMGSMLPTVLQMQGVKFDWKEDSYGGKDNFGFIAEDMAEVLPEVVSFTEDGKARGIQYTKLTAVLVEALKEQQKQIDELKSKIN